MLTHERRGDDDGSAYISALEKVAKQWAESGRSFEIKVAVKPTDPVDDAVEVTPPG